MASDLAVAVEWDVLTGDIPAMAKTLNTLRYKEPDIVSVWITGDQDQVLVQSGKKELYGIREFHAPIITAVLSKSKEETGIIDPDNVKEVGRVYLQFSLQNLEQEIKDMRMAGVNVVILVILFAFVFMFFEVRWSSPARC